MNEIQKWLKEHDTELSLIANAYGLNQVEAIVKILDEGMDKNLDDTADLIVDAEY